MAFQRLRGPEHREQSVTEVVVGVAPVLVEYRHHDVEEPVQECHSLPGFHAFGVRREVPDIREQHRHVELLAIEHRAARVDEPLSKGRVHVRAEGGLERLALAQTPLHVVEGGSELTEVVGGRDGNGLVEGAPPHPAVAAIRSASGRKLGSTSSPPKSSSMYPVTTDAATSAATTVDSRVSVRLTAAAVSTPVKKHAEAIATWKRPLRPHRAGADAMLVDRSWAVTSSSMGRRSSWNPVPITIPAPMKSTIAISGQDAHLDAGEIGPRREDREEDPTDGQKVHRGRPHRPLRRRVHRSLPRRKGIGGITPAPCLQCFSALWSEADRRERPQGDGRGADRREDDAVTRRQSQDRPQTSKDQGQEPDHHHQLDHDTEGHGVVTAVPSPEPRRESPHAACLVVPAGYPPWPGTTR